MGAFEDDQSKLIEGGESLLGQLTDSIDFLNLLRMYNRWYTIATEFVKINARERFDEFARIHDENQRNLSSEAPNLHQFKTNFYKQLGTVEGSSDHYPKAFLI